MPSVYSNFITGPILTSGSGIPITDNLAVNPDAYIDSTVRVLVPFTATGGSNYTQTIALPSNFVVPSPSYVTFFLVGAQSGAPTGVSMTVKQNSSTGTDLINGGFTFSGDGPTTIATGGATGQWTGTGLAILTQFSSGNLGVTRTIAFTPSATTTGAGTSRIYIYIRGLYVDINDIHINT